MFWGYSMEFAIFSHKHVHAETNILKLKTPILNSYGEMYNIYVSYYMLSLGINILSSQLDSDRIKAQSCTSVLPITLKSHV